MKNICRYFVWHVLCLNETKKKKWVKKTTTHKSGEIKNKIILRYDVKKIVVTKMKKKKIDEKHQEKNGT